ncbi:hypothetical protein BGZ94_000023 [Podila epigama]|nr:hypothetical protein BGZ94_000023 [Podila epigama]
MSKATFERRIAGILHDFQKSRKVWKDLVGDGLTQANSLVNVQLQQGYVDSPGYWPPVLDQFIDLKDRFESKLQKKANALAIDFETTFTKMSAQYAKMKLQSSQFEYLMEEATETFGESFTYKEPVGTTCTMEQIWIQFQKVFGLYSLQIVQNREILDQLVARNQNLDHERILSGSISARSGNTSIHNLTSPSPGLSSTSLTLTTTATEKAVEDSTTTSSHVAGFHQIPPRRDKDQGMILLSAWLNQPHLETEALLTFDDFCAVEIFGTE